MRPVGEIPREQKVHDEYICIAIHMGEAKEWEEWGREGAGVTETDGEDGWKPTDKQIHRDRHRSGGRG